MKINKLIIENLEKDFLEEGCFTERMVKARKEARGKS